MSAFPTYNDTPTLHKFYSSLKALVGVRFWEPIPIKVDYEMSVTIGLALSPCPANTSYTDPKLSAIMNSESFVQAFPCLKPFTNTSMAFTRPISLPSPPSNSTTPTIALTILKLENHPMYLS
ncbi:hypothetical protein V6N13_148820 [Hibiscus sabdariffa]|uniref:Uncharacterized protein n=1 Tax=Hibiscus sabdariffa TaxID=183260 RepID=A0ABR2EJ68_9ROSI